MNEKTNIAKTNTVKTGAVKNSEAKSNVIKKSQANLVNDTLPILYSLRHCPFAMRARIAIFKSTQTVLLRDLVLSNKPNEMMAASPKATVPVVVLAAPHVQYNSVIEESLDVMLWALHESDPDNLLHRTDVDNDDTLTDMLAVINEFDTEFKTRLEAYKCAKRYKEHNIVECREACEVYIAQLEQRLTQHVFLMSKNESLLDIALLPFIRQFSKVERSWFVQSSYTHVKVWLNTYLQSVMFTKVMAKYPLWLDNYEDVLFGAHT